MSSREPPKEIRSRTDDVSLSDLVSYGPTINVSSKSTIFQATLGLRIKAGKLQQLWVGMSNGEQDWRDVPVEE